jgi:hypothetical protein
LYFYYFLVFLSLCFSFVVVFCFFRTFFIFFCVYLFVPFVTEADRDVCVAACACSADALMYAAPAMQGDRGVVLAAVRTSGWALEFASSEVRSDKAVVLEAVGGLGAAKKSSSRVSQDVYIYMYFLSLLFYTFLSWRLWLHRSSTIPF